MREILFRGQRCDNGEWVEGNYGEYYGEYYNEEKKLSCISIPSKETISGSWFYDVIPETVGQYTGLCDKNGTKIFEGDILLWHSEWGEDFITVVEWDNKRAYFGARESGFDIPPFEIDDDFSKVEIIGNVHDNPELLKE